MVSMPLTVMRSYWPAGTRRVSSPASIIRTNKMISDCRKARLLICAPAFRFILDSFVGKGCFGVNYNGWKVLS